jgi:hypothetical protein
VPDTMRTDTSRRTVYREKPLFSQKSSQIPAEHWGVWEIKYNILFIYHHTTRDHSCYNIMSCVWYMCCVCVCVCVCGYVGFKSLRCCLMSIQLAVKEKQLKGFHIIYKTYTLRLFAHVQCACA